MSTTNDLRRSVGALPERTLHRIVQRPGRLATEGQIETAGRAYVHATVWSAAAHALIDGARLVGRTLWLMAALAAIATATAWLYKHWPAVIRWL